MWQMITVVYCSHTNSYIWVLIGTRTVELPNPFTTNGNQDRNTKKELLLVSNRVVSEIDYFLSVSEKENV
jgi:hypothetical protein